MIDCKDCGMSFNLKEFKDCPYCGQKPDDDSIKADQPPLAGDIIEVEDDVPGEDDIEIIEKTPDNDDVEIEMHSPERAEPSAEDLRRESPPKLEPLPQEDRAARSAGRKPAGGKLKFALIGLAVVVVAALGVFAAIYTLNSSGVTVPDKYATIQEAIDAAEDGEEIIVDIGVYRENIDFKGKELVLRSTYPDDPAVVDQTIIDGGGSGTVVSFRSGEGEGAVLSGFTVTRGSGILISGDSSPVIEKCIIEDNTAEYGGGIAVFDSSPTIIDNSIFGNHGFLGGGIYLEQSSARIENNRITANRAEMGSGLVVISESSPLIVNNTISDNYATRIGGGLVVAINSAPTVRENTITGNIAERNGGGILIEESEPIVEGNTIAGNRAANGGGIFIVNTLSTALLISGNSILENLAAIAGGGLFMEGSSPTLEDNVFNGNRSERLGGGVVVYNSRPVIGKNTFEENRAGDEGGGALWVSADSELVLGEPDSNSYLQNIPDDIYQEE